MAALVWYAVACVGGVGAAVLALFAHELAHAVPILLAGGRAHVTVGDDEGRTANVGPLTVTVGFDRVATLLVYGYYEPSGVDSRAVHAVSTLAGPAVTVAVVAAAVAALLSVEHGPLVLGIWFVLVSELRRGYYTLVPMTYSREPYAGDDSDMKRFLRLVRG
jgi:hypothetical protein